MAASRAAPVRSPASIRSPRAGSPGHAGLDTAATPDLIVHHSAIKADAYRGLQEDQRVEFSVGRGAKGPRAEEVRPV